MALASESPRKSSLTGSHFSFRLSFMAMLHRWQEVIARWCEYTSEMGSLRSLLGLFLLVGKYLVDQISFEAAAVDEDVFLLALEVYAVSRSVFHDDLVAIGESQGAGKRLCRVVTVLSLVEKAAALDLHRAAVLGADSPLGNVHVMGTPVGQFPAGIIQPPAKCSVATFLDIRDQRCLAQPEIPVDILGRLLFFERSTLGARADVTGCRQFLTQASASGDGHCLLEAAVASLLGTDLEDTVRLLKRLADQLAFVDGKRQGLFAIDVLARTHGGKVYGRVPMVRCAADDGVDVFSFEQFSVIFVGVDFRTGFVFRPFGKAGRLTGVYVAASHQVAIARCGPGVSRSPPTATDKRDVGAVVLRLGLGIRTTPHIRHSRRTADKSSGKFQEAATLGRLTSHARDSFWNTEGRMQWGGDRWLASLSAMERRRGG